MITVGNGDTMKIAGKTGGICTCFLTQPVVFLQQVFVGSKKELFLF